MPATRLISTSAKSLTPDPWNAWTDFEVYCRAVFPDSGKVVGYFDFGVFFARFEGGCFRWAPAAADRGVPPPDPSFIQRLRIFNDDRELYVWRYDVGTFQARMRMDAEGGPEMLTWDREPYLLGSVTALDGDFAWLAEERGSRFAVPLAQGERVAVGDALKLKLRCYLAADSVHRLVGISDLRWVGFVKER